MAPERSSDPLLLVFGHDALAERVCAELTATAGHRVRVVWSLDVARVAAFRERHAVARLGGDSPRDLDTLGTKIEQSMPDCTALSLAAHSASTFGASALDPGCFFALRFPQTTGAVVGFAEHAAGDIGVSGLTVGQAEERLEARIVALGMRRDPPSGAVISRDDGVVTFGRISECAAHRAPAPVIAPAEPRAASNVPVSPVQRLVGAWHRVNPILRTFAVAAVVFFSASFCFFHFTLGKTWTAAAFYVVETMTNVGFGEVQVTQRGPLITAAAITAMLGGIVFTSIFIGSVASALTRAQWIATQGLRRIRARRHVVVCGGGKIGAAVINLLTDAGKRVIVIEPHPDADLVRRAQERDVDLLTGDASRDGALDMCDLGNASAVLALTNNDSTNLEIALGARVRSPEVPLVVRMENASYARATSKVFGISTFSPAALSAPAFAGLARFPGTRGRVRYAGEDHTIGQRTQGSVPQRPPADDCTALCVFRDGRIHMIHEFAEMRAFDVVLFAVPLSQFRPEAGAVSRA